MDSELKPCPFCGGEADYVGSEGSGYNVECQRCRARSGWGDYGYQTAAKWNTRALEQREAVPAEVMAALDRMCTPLDASVLSGATSRADAHDMAIIRAHILATPPRDVPEGFVLVPRVPTEAMLAAFRSRYEGPDDDKEDFEQFIAAAIAAAPSGKVG